MRFITQKNSSILREMVGTDFKVRYQGSILGYMWSFLRPLFLFLILYIVFTKIFKVGKTVQYYPVYLLLGIVLWNFFTEATSNAMTSIVARGDLIKKISIPKYLLIISSVSSAFINLILNLIIIFFISIFTKVPLGFGWFMIIPLSLELVILALSLGFMLSTIFVKFRDLTYVWEVFIQAAFYATPILYPLSLITNVKFQKLLMINPVAQVIQDARYFLVTHQTIISWKILSPIETTIPMLIILIIAIPGIFYFKKQSKYFAENI